MPSEPMESMNHFTYGPGMPSRASMLREEEVGGFEIPPCLPERSVLDQDRPADDGRRQAALLRDDKLQLALVLGQVDLLVDNLMAVVER
ncbi:hypothetical protein TYRP_006169 [Tyrophagus putrescentiae]|nr:hypothetical protein TYRP_006169 [Tyrophagus putrescentiae]